MRAVQGCPVGSCCIVADRRNTVMYRTGNLVVLRLSHRTSPTRWLLLTNATCELPTEGTELRQYGRRPIGDLKGSS